MICNPPTPLELPPQQWEKDCNKLANKFNGKNSALTISMFMMQIRDKNDKKGKGVI
jgi:hypothetical protein